MEDSVFGENNIIIPKRYEATFERNLKMKGGETQKKLGLCIIIEDVFFELSNSCIDNPTHQLVAKNSCFTAARWLESLQGDCKQVIHDEHSTKHVLRPA